MMRKPEKSLTRRLALLLCLPIWLCATFSMMTMAEAAVIDIETYDGVVILEDPELIGDVEEEGVDPTGTPTHTPTSQPTQSPTTAPTTPPTEAPVAAFDISMAPPDGWYLNRAAMEITINDVNGTGWSHVKIVQNSTLLISGALASGHLWIDLLDNCTITVTVTDPYGKEHEKSVEVRCFDHDAPTLKASVKGEYLHVEAVDLQSGIGSVQVNGTKYTDLTDSQLDIHLKEYADAYEQLLVQAVDKVGNTSKAIAVANPFFHNTPSLASTATLKPTSTPKPTKQPSSGSGGNTGSNGNAGNSSGSGTRATPSPTPTLVPTITPMITPVPTLTGIGAGSPFSTGGNAFTRDLLYDKFTNKQFIAIETRNGDVFYMVIDYDKPLDDKGEKYETYFLNLVDSRDLLDIVDSSELQQEPEVIYITPNPTMVPTAAPAPMESSPKKDSSGATVGIIAIMLAAAGGALWYFKFRKPGAGKGKARVDDYGFDDDDEDIEERDEGENM